MKVTETVFLVGGGETETVFTDRMDCNVYLMQAGDLYLLIDSGGGMAADQVVDNIRGHGVDPARVEWLLLTHAHGDHAAGAAPLKQRLPNLKVALSAEAAGWLRSGDEKAINLDKGRATGMYPPGFQFLPCPVDLELQDNQELELGGKVFQVVATPGHCAGHMSFLVEDGGKRALFAGDAIFPEGKILLQNIGDCDLHQSIRSVERLAQLRPDHLFAGHRRPIVDQAASPFQARDRPNRRSGRTLESVLESLQCPWRGKRLG